MFKIRNPFRRYSGWTMNDEGSSYQPIRRGRGWFAKRKFGRRR